MPFQKKHKLGALPFNEEPFDKSPVCFKVREGVREKLKTVPGWQERLREFVDELIESAGDSCQ
ncbi:hypothetical protein [Scytonema sp. PCC 10023]|uniref:hypothetical protein n=1 Tax=Scytonema sp. PCC 10023 TaxID=1680591 RepID=UPI0039C74B28